MHLILRILVLLATAMLPGGLFIIVGIRMLRVKRVIPISCDSYKGGHHVYPNDSWHRYVRARHPVRYFLTETVPARIFRRKETSS